MLIKYFNNNIYELNTINNNTLTLSVPCRTMVEFAFNTNWKRFWSWMGFEPRTSWSLSKKLVIVMYLMLKKIRRWKYYKIITIMLQSNNCWWYFLQVNQYSVWILTEETRMWSAFVSIRTRQRKLRQQRLSEWLTTWSIIRGDNYKTIK